MACGSCGKKKVALAKAPSAAAPKHGESTQSMVVLNHNGLLELPGGRVIKHVFPGCIVMVTQEESKDERLAPATRDVLRVVKQMKKGAASGMPLSG